MILCKKKKESDGAFTIKKSFISTLIIMGSLTQYSYGADSTVINWVSKEDKGACYYRKYKPSEMIENQRLIEGYIWLANNYDTWERKKETYGELLYKHSPQSKWRLNEPKWVEISGYAKKIEKGHRMGYSEKTFFDIMPKNDGQKSIYLTSYLSYDFKSDFNGDVLRFDRVDVELCLNKRKAIKE